MRWLKKDNGHTLLEMIMISGLLGILLLLLWTNYFSIYNSFIKANKKVQNLEEARITINFINDTFQRYKMESCQIRGNKTIEELEVGETDTVKQIVFRDNQETIVIKYNPKDQIIRFQTQEIASNIANFTVSHKEQLLDFNISVTKDGKGVLPDETITVGTTVNLQYNR